MFVVRLARRVCAYVRSHKKLFIIGGLLGGAVAVGGWYVRRKLVVLRRRMARQQVRMGRVSKLLELNERRTAHVLMSLMPELRGNLLKKLLDMDDILHRARSKTERPEVVKHAQLELQRLSFCRLLAAIYLVAMVRLALGVVMSIQGRRLVRMMDEMDEKRKLRTWNKEEEEGVEVSEEWMREHFPGESSSFSLVGLVLRHIMREDGMLVLSQAVSERVNEVQTSQKVSLESVFELKDFFKLIFAMRTSVENLEIPTEGEGRSEFCASFDELLLPPTNRLETQDPVVLEMIEEIRELVRSDEFQMCFTETCDDLFGQLVPAIKKINTDSSVPVMLLVPHLANEAWNVLQGKDSNGYYQRVMRSSSPVRLNQFLMLSIFQPEDFELGSGLDMML